MYYILDPTGDVHGPFSIEDIKSVNEMPKGDLAWETEGDLKALDDYPEIKNYYFNISDNLNKDEAKSENQSDEDEDYNEFVDYEDEERNNWDAYTDGQYGDYDGPIDPELIGL